MIKFPDKDPTDVSDFTLDWSGVLDADTVASFDNLVITPVTDPLLEEQQIGSPLAPVRTITDTSTTFWLQAGKPGTKYTLAVTITTAGGRIYERSASVKVKNL